MATLVSTNPAKNYEIVGEVDVSTESEIKDKVAKAQNSKKAWKAIGVKKRVELLSRVLEIYLSRKEELAAMITREIGKPILQSRLDLEGDEIFFRWYLENVENSLEKEVTFEDEKTIHEIFYEPAGVAAVIQPWNFPTSQFIWNVIPNLLVGNPVVFKHSEECPLSGKLLEEIFVQAGLPEGVFSEVYGDGSVGELLINQNVDLINFTGSTRTGQHIYQVGAGKQIKVLTELGGSSPGVILKDGDVDLAMEVIWGNRFMNNGQICDGLKRLIVHQSKVEEVTEKLKALIESKKVGNPEDEDSDFGPLVSRKQLETLKGQVDRSTELGAKILTGGKEPDGLVGAYYLPTIISGVTREMPVWKEEVFGPVLPVVTFDNLEEAIALANDTVYGLGAYILGNLEDALEVANKLETGNVSINGVPYVEPFNPFGGYKKSGIGRENGVHGFQELSQVKVVSRNK